MSIAPMTCVMEGIAPVLVVRLDAILSRRTALLEVWWNLCSRDVWAAFKALSGLFGGRGGFAECLASQMTSDTGQLPFDKETLRVVCDQRAKGGKVVLLLPEGDALAQTVSNHIGWSDGVIVADQDREADGWGIAENLERMFGAREFDYIDGASSGLPDQGDVQPRRADGTVSEAGHTLRQTRARGQAREWLRACRPRQWAKNILIFLPVLLAHSQAPDDWIATVLAFVCFSMVASSVYLLNDLLDLAPDRNHPRKRARPLAAGTMDLWHATLLAPALLIGGVVLAALTLSAAFQAVLGVYVVVTMLYSLWLKRMLMIDICTLAGLYTLRIVAGAAAIMIVPSTWFLGFSIFLFLSLAAIKRQTELVSDFKSGRSGVTRRAYQTDDLPMISTIAIAAGFASVVVMALYISSADVRALYSTPILLWAVCPVILYWIGRAAVLANRGDMPDDPVVFALKDRVSLTCGAIVFVVAFAAI